MFVPVTRRLIHTLIYLLVVGQVLLAAPVTAAISGNTSATSTEMPCADSMPQADHSKPCPCCPDGTAGVAACLSACTASVAAVTTLSVQFVKVAAEAPPDMAITRTATLAEPPLKPPPIV